MSRAAVVVALSLVTGACSTGQPRPAVVARPAPAPATNPAAPPAASGSGVYTVTFGVDNRAGRLGAVQFEARVGAGADWQGAGASVACRNASGASMMACNDKGGGVLSCGFVDTAGVSTPCSLVSCSITSSKPLAASDFTVKVVDASSPDMKPAKATIVITSVAGR